jgi:predicted site-specific integrase-resolvase
MEKAGRMRHQLYNTEMLADLLKVSIKTVNRERAEGKLNFIRVVGGKIYYRESDVFEYLDSMKALKEQINHCKTVVC